jgi:hypothetical protein
VYPWDSTRTRNFVVPGERAGPSVFPMVNYPELQPLVPGEMDFKHYHSRLEIEWWMRKWAAEYPAIVEYYEVGRSFGNVPIMQLTLTNKSTGGHTDKPAAFFEGGRHSGEITSTESAFYLAWYLVENYGKNADVTRLLDQKAIYIRPLNNPDGSDLYRLTAQANRSTVRPYDSDGDGLMDENPGEDLDGDGYIRQMRQFVGAGNGSFVIDSAADPRGRLMRNVGQGNGSYNMYSEGVDRDGDGRIGEDGIGGLDLHRNYPQNWRPMPGGDSTGRGYTQGGAGAYPLSEPETKSVYMWMMTHPNISVVNTMDTSVPMHLRPPSTCEEEECMYAEDLRWYQHFDSVGLTITEYPWAGNVFRTYATRNNPNANPSPLFGHSPDFGYFGYGSIWYGDELWNGGRERDYNNDGRIEQWEVLRYCDEEFGGRCFQEWTPFNHPTLGPLEIGGFNPKFWSQNGPPETLEKWASRQAMFNLYMAQSLPRIEIASATVARAAAGSDATHEITVVVRNSGRLPTALEQAKRVKIVRPDRLVVQAGGGSSTRVVGGQPEMFWLDGMESRTFTIRVQATGTSPADRQLTLRALSTRGGVAEHVVRW